MVPPDQQLTVGTTRVLMESRIQNCFKQYLFSYSRHGIRVVTCCVIVTAFFFFLYTFPQAPPPVVMQVRLFFVDKGIKSLLWSQWDCNIPLTRQ